MIAVSVFTQKTLIQRSESILKFTSCKLWNTIASKQNVSVGCADATLKGVKQSKLCKEVCFIHEDHLPPIRISAGQDLGIKACTQAHTPQISRRKPYSLTAATMEL